MRLNETRFPGIYESQGRRKTLYTRNLVPGEKVYGESLVRAGGKEYRRWDPMRSKLAAAVLKGLNQLGLAPGQNMLYLGASTGTTVSHVSDVLGKGGLLFAVEHSPSMARELVFLAEKRKNIHPVLADANHPERYQHRVPHVDFLYQDVAQRNQVDIFLKNVQLFLKPDAFCALCVKARSIDISKKPHVLFKEVCSTLDARMLVVDTRDLAPFQKDHMFFVCKKREGRDEN